MEHMGYISPGSQADRIPSFWMVKKIPRQKIVDLMKTYFSRWSLDFQGMLCPAKTLSQWHMKVNTAQFVKMNILFTHYYRVFLTARF